MLILPNLKTISEIIRISKNEETNMKIGPNFIMSVLNMLYPKMRPALFDAVNNPDSEWDDLMMDIMDKLFNYEEK